MDDVQGQQERLLSRDELFLEDRRRRDVWAGGVLQYPDQQGLAEVRRVIDMIAAVLEEKCASYERTPMEGDYMLFPVDVWQEMLDYLERIRKDFPLLDNMPRFSTDVHELTSALDSLQHVGPRGRVAEYGQPVDDSQPEVIGVSVPAVYAAHTSLFLVQSRLDAVEPRRSLQASPQYRLAPPMNEEQRARYYEQVIKAGTLEDLRGPIQDTQQSPRSSPEQQGRDRGSQQGGQSRGDLRG
jgi:hypothetical protein